MRYACMRVEINEYQLHVQHVRVLICTCYNVTPPLRTSEKSKLTTFGSHDAVAMMQNN